MNLRASSLPLAFGLAALSAAQGGSIIVGSGAGVASQIRVFNSETLAERVAFSPFGSFSGGVRVATGDVNGDGVADIVAGAGASSGGGPRVKVFDGTTLATLADFNGFEAGFTGGVTVATGDVDSDGRADVIVGAASGSSQVRVVDVITGNTLRNFFAFDAGYAGGVTTAVSDVDSDGRADLVVGTASGTSRVRAFDLQTLTPTRDFFAFEPAYAGGVNVAAGDLNADGGNEIYVGAALGSSQVKAFEPNGGVSSNFLAFASGGVNLAALPGIGVGRIVAGSTDSTLVKLFDPITGAETASFEAFARGSGVFVAATPQAVPEPGTMAVLALGLGFLRRRAKKS